MNKAACAICLLLLAAPGWAQTPSANPNSTAPFPVILDKDYFELRIRANRLNAQELSALRDQAVAGDVRVSDLLGMAYQMGCPGSPSDAQEALRWYHLAADKGSSIAANQIGIYFDPAERFAGEHGRDPDEALRWYRKAAERGDDATALYNVGETLHQMVLCSFLS